MAAASVQRTNGPWKMLAFTSLLLALLLNGMMAQGPQDSVRGDNIVNKTTALATAKPQDQNIVFPTMDAQTAATIVTKPPPDLSSSKVPFSKATVPAGTEDKGAKATQTDKPIVNPETPVPDPPRGDNSNNKPKPKPGRDVVCVGKDDVEGKNAVQLKLKVSSDCNKTRMSILSVLPELCAKDCTLKLYQEDNSKEVLVSGKYVEDDVAEMTKKFKNDNIKDKINVDEADTRWGENSKLVLVSLLVAGLMLAALLVAGYYLKTHRKNSKGVRLADSFQVDEENQTNTLVSVAPLHQEPVDKPAINGESPPENGTNPAPTTNGHSANQTQVADTEM